MSCDKEQQYKALHIRSHAFKELQDEKCNAYFFGRIQTRRKSNKIKSVKNPETGTIHEDNPSMIDIFEKCYRDLYKDYGGDNSIQNELLGSITSKLKTDHSTNITQDIIKSNLIEKTLTLMENNKTPGPDGLTVEFYKCFFNDISDIIIDLFIETIQHGVLPPSMSQAVTVLIPKDNNPSNYRPTASF